MNRYFYSNESEFNPVKDIEIFNIYETDIQDESIYKTISYENIDDINDCLYSSHLSDKSLGFFPEIDSISEYYF